ncbi:MAG: CxxxxCH/CxxCH domain c-type cytochrome [Trichloromonadaceae bacterium]
MNPKMLLGLLVALWLILPGSAEARPVHFFDCKDCHTASLDLLALGNTNLCLKCHKDTPPAVTFNDLTTGHKPKGLFHPNEISDALGSATAAGMAPAPTLQTSHFWAAKKDNVPAAGALPPSRALYTSRYGISTGKVTCTRCHDPHLPATTDPKLLRMSAAGDQICLDCHRPWKVSNNRGLTTHPLVADYAAVAVANPTKYKASVTNTGSGGVQLIGGGVSCSSCHGAHFSDSHSGTPDGRDNRAGLQPGDGKLLRSDGPKRTGGSAAETAQLRSNLCQACHTYKTHGSNNVIGCLDCHSGHVYNGGDPNYFVLRASIASVYAPKNSAVGAVNNIQFKSASAEWMNAGGSGYCQSCHNLPAPHNGLSSGTSAANSCGECHAHGHASRSFTASCADCHGTPPTADSPPPAAGGYAKSGSYDYSTSVVYKNESLTPHGSHAGGTDYRFACDVCHLGKSHATGTFQDVFKPASIHALASGGGATAPSYNGTGSGTCSAVYCHSNGGARGAAPVVAPGGEWGNGAWAGGIDVISGKLPVNRCKSCHGNDSASMSARGNSASHQKHLAKGYSCNVCHANTASSASALVPGAIGTTHVNGSSEVSFDNSHELSVGRPLGTGSYASVGGTCSIYCHSNGQGTLATPDWDIATSGACGTCHAVTSATLTSGSHAAHLNSGGANLACDACHGAGAVSGSHAGHVNGTIDRLTQAASCNSCHGIEEADVAPPVWGNVASAKCDHCHAGASITSYTDRSNVVRSASAKSAYSSAGHGKSGIAQGCTVCHSTTSDAAHMGAGSTTRLKTIGGETYTAEAPNAFCSACHDGGSGNETPHFAAAEGHTSTDANLCNACHDPHGVAGYDAMVKSSIGGNAVATFANKTERTSYVNNGNDGICQVCHVDGEVRYFNRSTNDTNHAAGRLCIDCHDHTAEVAFKASCSGCHGGGHVGPTSGARNFWPDGMRTHDANQAGAHEKHMLEIAARFNPAWTTVNALLNGATITQQLEMCEFCHAAVTNDNDHGNPGTAEVFVAQIGNPAVATRFAKQLWTPFANDNDAAYSAGSCSAVDCHNGKTTPDANKWYPGHGTGTCVMCHDGDVSGPASGSHLAHRGSNSTFAYNFTCADCHGSAMTWSSTTAGTKPPVGHLDGVKVVGITGDFTYNADTLSCGTNSCHNDGKGGPPKVAHAWGTEIDGCTNCHHWLPNTQGHPVHFDFDNNTVGTRLQNCTPCHQFSSPSHLNRSVDFIAGMNYDGDVDVRPDSGIGKCSTTICHNNGLGTPVVTPLWTETAVGVGKTTCTLCHAGVPNTGSHAKHVVLGQVPTAYDGAGLQSTTATDYSYRCDACHTTALADHVNNAVNLKGSVDYESDTYTLAQLQAVGAGNNGKCSSASCHSTGATPVVYTPTPIWGQSFTGDPCAGCHGNSPNNVVHHEHEVGFHYKAVYSGTTGFLPVTDADPIPAGLTGARAQLRGHGGRLLDGTPSSTTLTCNVCHFDTVKVSHNSTSATCASCHTTPLNPTPEQKAVGNAAMTIADKTKHLNGQRDVKFFDQKVRSKAQLRDDLKDVPELANNWKRVGGYKAATGLSYDELPKILSEMATWNSADKTCTVACHLWEANRVDKVPVKWDGGPIMCIDCHTRLPR